jgi:phosphoribosylaminoimidazolecarboxamide formyltransferase/IMP cyclohydrolase
MFKQAVLSVSDDTGLIELARSLLELGFHLIASEGTEQKISSALNPKPPVNSIPFYTVETLGHFGPPLERELAMGVLTGRIRSSLEDNIEVVICNFRRVKNDGDQVLRDIGGPNFVSATTMSHRFVIVDPADYDELIKVLRCASDEERESFRVSMDMKALAAVSEYHKETAFQYRMLQDPVLPTL